MHGAPTSWTDPPLGLIESVADIVRIAEAPGAEQNLYRGQSEDVRPHPQTRRDGRSLDPAAESAMLAEFRRRARPFLTYEPQGKMEWLALAEHHGLPTRLLDWTESILVAAFFAVETFRLDPRPGTQPALVIARGGRELHADDDPFADDIEGIYRTRHVAGRVAAQGGIFTVHGHAAAGRFERFHLARWHIAPEQAASIQRALDRLGVNAASLFPDLDGLCRWLAWRSFDRPAAGRQQQVALQMADAT